MRDNQTHIALSNPTTETEQLFRASDGMRIGSCKELLVVWGDDPNKAVGRCFLTHEHALKYLRHTVAQNDAEALGVPLQLEIRNAEKLLIQPGEVLALPGQMRKMQ